MTRSIEIKINKPHRNKDKKWQGPKYIWRLKKDKTIQEYIRLLKLTKGEYQKLFEENKIVKIKNWTCWKRKNIKREKITKKNNNKVETDSEEKEEKSKTQEEEGESSEEVFKTIVYKKIRKR